MSLRVAGGQIDLTVGDLEGNEARILDTMKWAEAEHADVLLLPELAITGYPPEDLVLREGFVSANLAVLDRLAAASGDTTVIVGFVDRLAEGRVDDDAIERHVANAAAILGGGTVAGVYHKELLPNYGVFDEARYFAEGIENKLVWTVSTTRIGVSVCEDIWSADGPPGRQAAAGARVLMNINGSPYHVGKPAERHALLRAEAVRSGAAVVYLNTVGGQDELVFDGDSMVFDARGHLLYRAPLFREDRFVVDVPLDDVVGETSSPADEAGSAPGPVSEVRMGEEEEVYTALATGLKSYVTKNGFSEVVLGLSGGIDSALTATIAVDALGPEAVRGVTMPSRYSSEGSVADSERLARLLGCRFDVIPIDDVFGSLLDALEPHFAGAPPGVAEENLQARVRGTMLMAISNKFGGMVLATGNKSEMAVGYATLYGDMAGGFSVLKDVYKTSVYALARWRNRTTEVIPVEIIEKEPSAELRPDQKDSDSLPP